MDTGRTPRFVVLEGVDGTGKTALFTALAAYYKLIFSNVPLFADRFPGTQAGTLGEWVYRFHRNRVTRAPSTAKITIPALQMLHEAAHIDAIQARITPVFAAGGNILLDRYWWSAYVYSRSTLTPEQAMALVAPERMFWEPLIRPTIIYVSRTQSLKEYQVTPERHKELDGYYRELIANQTKEGVTIHELRNDAPLVEAWRTLLGLLDLPYTEMDSLLPGV